MRFLVGRLLADAGYEVRSAGTAWEAMRILQEPEWRPDLMLLDVRLPEVSGWDLLTWLRAQPEFPGLPVVLSTVRGDDEDRVRACERGCTGFVMKPFDVRALVAAVGELSAQFA